MPVALYIDGQKVLEIYDDETTGQPCISLCMGLGYSAEYRKKLGAEHG
jgi:hypothetical protein